MYLFQQNIHKNLVQIFISIIIAQCLWYFLLQSKLFPHVDAMRNRKFFERLPAGYLRCFRQQLLIVHWFHIQWGKVQTSDAVTQEIFAECNDCSLHRAFTKLCIWLIMPHVFWLHGNVLKVWISWIVHLSLVRKSLWINLSTMHWDLTSELIRSISKCAWLSEVWPKNWSFRSCGPTQRCCLSIWAGHRNHKLRQARLTYFISYFDLCWQQYRGCVYIYIRMYICRTRGSFKMPLDHIGSPLHLVFIASNWSFNHLRWSSDSEGHSQKFTCHDFLPMAATLLLVIQ